MKIEPDTHENDRSHPGEWYFPSSGYCFISFSLSLTLSLFPRMCVFSVLMFSLFWHWRRSPKKKAYVLWCQYTSDDFIRPLLTFVILVEKNPSRWRCIIVVRILSQRNKRKCVCGERMGVFNPDTVSARFVASRNKRSRPL